MRNLRTFLTCLVALALHSAAWAEIYETTDAQGNTEFTDSPADEGAEVVELQQTNLADAPQPEAQTEEQAETVAVEQQPVGENNTIIIHDGNDNDGYDDSLARERALNELDPAAPREVLDGEAPREIGDSNAGIPRETGDVPMEHRAVHRR
jgi:hypothetical protein